MAVFTEKVCYWVEVDYNGICRVYTSLAVAKREANKLAKRFGQGCCCKVTAEVIEKIFTYKNGKVHKVKSKLITDYTY